MGGEGGVHVKLQLVRFGIFRFGSNPYTMQTFDCHSPFIWRITVASPNYPVVSPRMSYHMGRTRIVATGLR